MIQHGPIARIGSCGPVFLSCRQGDERTKATSSARGLREPEAPAWRDPTPTLASRPRWHQPLPPCCRVGT